MSNSAMIRVRFAPSPTGFLHIGGLRTALYNFLFSRKHGGVFVLRIEDTDRSRYVEGAVDNLINTLSWAGLEFDEGPRKGGSFGPYVQSERLDIYRQHSETLLRNRKAYRCFCTPDRLEGMRRQQEKMKIPPKYDRRCFRLGESEIHDNLKAGIPHVVRMVVPDNSKIAFHDVIRERVEFESDRVDDQVILKSDGYPTYHLANVVDDHLMQITHVIRGEEWLSSTPKHVLLYQYFGWDSPIFAHLPLLLNPDRTKLSKRQGDVAAEDYRAKGYLPEALINFVALLGWNPGDNRELFAMEDLIREFSLERVGRSGAVFNLDKLNWMNEQYIRRTGEERLALMIEDALRKSNLGQSSTAYIQQVIRLMRDRITTVNDFVSSAAYFFTDQISYNETARAKNWTVESPKHIAALVTRVESLESLTPADAEDAIRKTAEEHNVAAGKIIHAVRLALTGFAVGPSLFELMEVLGKERVLRRLRAAVDQL